jgi:hypothetical protein
MPSTPVTMLGKNEQGLNRAQFGDEIVFICDTEMTIKDIT